MLTNEVLPNLCTVGDVEVVCAGPLIPVVRILSSSLQGGGGHGQAALVPPSLAAPDKSSQPLFFISFPLFFSVYNQFCPRFIYYRIFLPALWFPSVVEKRRLQSANSATGLRFFLVSIQKPNSWMYNFVEVSGHNLESSQTWGVCVDFLNHMREGEYGFLSGFPPFSFTVHTVQ